MRAKKMSQPWQPMTKEAFAKLLYDTSAGCSQALAAAEYRILLEHVEAMRVSLEDNRVLAQQMARWILHYPNDRRDHACSRCVPGGEIVVSGFVCAWHIAEGLRAAVAVAAAKSGA